MASIFTRIITGEIPCYKVAETEKFLAFLDVFPLVQGHTLVIPKKEIDYIFDIPEPDFSELHAFSKIIASAIVKAMPCKRIGTAVIGLEVPHAHIHLVPINEVGDLNFSRPKLSFTKEEMEETAAKIRACL